MNVESVCNTSRPGAATGKGAQHGIVWSSWCPGSWRALPGHALIRLSEHTHQPRWVGPAAWHFLTARGAVAKASICCCHLLSCCAGPSLHQLCGALQAFVGKVLMLAKPWCQSHQGGHPNASMQNTADDLAVVCCRKVTISVVPKASAKSEPASCLSACSHGSVGATGGQLQSGCLSRHRRTAGKHCALSFTGSTACHAAASRPCPAPISLSALCGVSVGCCFCYSADLISQAWPHGTSHALPLCRNQRCSNFT